MMERGLDGVRIVAGDILCAPQFIGNRLPFVASTNLIELARSVSASWIGPFIWGLEAHSILVLPVSATSFTVRPSPSAGPYLSGTDIQSGDFPFTENEAKTRR